ncbi:TetR family transcriptional regulator [Saccharopolyspora erythraea NRRL 2338]|uniref:TetR-family transcriptional regulator n=2 Tax=Saccharopolyspora erythraea TaxID=1836 RepID=A4FLG0_SACEN|nr:TetR/AcrR family transcriptional regulator [Saccharopolyspora erythraea]EQD81311.1 TetR family transcriptional regulator [Saccharopolyspora erythraea D]PFG98527.1 TetR family transcriptional regulator [Saccharopolyspora erythraea NRRL 2338]QRK88573.1 TetR/AcrR family transcriptional regulator C-terminal domain-containing protein [Saccharopolyspora erythraea]CAM04885.1 TetR-family transcriptional regulator [Saccharopolyspora erythraea NRRL 2338]
MPRPSNPLLSADRIRRAGLEIIDARGLEGLSMRGLADELGVKAASLYNHVPAKEQLLQEIADDVTASVDVSGFEVDWPTGIRTWARSYRAALTAHPNLVPYIASGPARREAALRRADAVHGGLTRAGWPQRYATMIGASTKYLVVGSAMGSFSGGFVDDAEVYDERFPHLDRAHLLREHAAEIDNDSFELALAALIDGLHRLYHDLVDGDGPQVRARPEG